MNGSVPFDETGSYTNPPALLPSPPEPLHAATSASTTSTAPATARRLATAAVDSFPIPIPCSVAPGNPRGSPPDG
jgi:hypothetical protein